MVENFGKNVCFQPAHVFTPSTEAELLQLMSEYRDRTFRVIGRGHCWSELIETTDILLDLRRFNSVVVQVDQTGQATANIGAGCQIKELLKQLLQQGNWTTPALGLITEQAIAGATATSTHGSGRHSLSHYIQSLRIAVFDPLTGEPTIRTVDSGPELQAARCSLGCLGIVISVIIPVRQRYLIEEHFRRYKYLAEVISAEQEYPLQQFYVAPFRWDYYAQHRREVAQSRSFTAGLYRLFWSIGMDRLHHWVIIALARWLPAICNRFYFYWIVPNVLPRGWKVIDYADRQLIMEHELYRHIEIEIFVRQEQLAPTIEYCIWLLRHLSGEQTTAPTNIETSLKNSNHWSEIQRLKGQYQQHYPICIRKVLADDTLISMASDANHYAISFISYAATSERDRFFAVAKILAETTASLFRARPHWGKYCPLSAIELRQLYPGFEQFAKLVQEFDPRHQFQNQWTESFFT